MAAYTDEQLQLMRRLILGSTTKEPIAGKQLDARCNTTPHSRAAIVKTLREQGDPIIGRDWRQPFGYFWGVEGIDCEEQSQSCFKKATSYMADERRFREHAARLLANRKDRQERQADLINRRADQLQNRQAHFVL